MAKTTLQISIPEPCHEDWSKMTPTQCGAFCNACQKEVVDFSQMSDAEIVERLSKASGKVCGRIAADKLNRDLVKYEPDHAWYSWKKWAVAAGVLLGANNARAENNPAYLHQVVMPATINPTDTINAADSITISGLVTDNQGEPIEDASLQIWGTMYGTGSKADGSYTLTVSQTVFSNGFKLCAKRYEYNDTSTVINIAKDTVVNIVMERQNPIELDIVIVAGGMVRRKPTPAQKIRFFFRYIGNAFRKPANR